MGAMEYAVEITTNADARDAFYEAVQAARFEHGHGGYTGSIAEKTDYIIITTTPMAREDAEAEIKRQWDDMESPANDKWGPACAIALKESEQRHEVTGWLFFGLASY